MSGDLLAALSALLAAIGGAVWLYLTGRRSQRKETALEAAERYAATRKKMEDAEYETLESLGDDPAAARRFLRERGGSGGNL